MERIPNRNPILRKQDEMMTKTPHEYIRVTHEQHANTCAFSPILP